ncbi:hypothetical protein N7488_012325 [Penicillium malachiteum]|nr:hypothetical protein N7488_012325 [Penicillium malachiteum]
MMDECESTTQEQRSHKNTSHISPCTSTTTGRELMSEDRAAWPIFGGNAAGGSGYNDNVGMGGPEGKNNMNQKPTIGGGANYLAQQ